MIMAVADHSEIDLKHNIYLVTSNGFERFQNNVISHYYYYFFFKTKS